MHSCESTKSRGSCEIEKSSTDEKRSKPELDFLLRDQLSRISHKLLVMSGKGGVGKSSVASALSLGLSRLGNRVGRLDIDPHGPGIALLRKLPRPTSEDRSGSAGIYAWRYWGWWRT